MPKRESDPPPESIPPFNPLDKKQLAISVGEALLASDLHPLAPHKRFAGAGVYAIYYFGASAVYQSLAKFSSESPQAVPIYVGKAIPSGGRKGVEELNAGIGTSLHKRLAEHAESIRQTQNLQIEDFKCRYLIIDEIWIPLGESLLIRRFRPVWNVVIDGFGNHDPGSGRHKQQRSSWDILHPGRPWAERLESGPRNQRSLVEDVERHFT